MKREDIATAVGAGITVALIAGLVLGIAFAGYLLPTAADGQSQRWADWGTVVVAALALLVAVVQAGLFFYQLRLMREALQHSANSSDAAMESIVAMREISRRQLRAYVHIDTADIDFPKPGTPLAEVVLKNCGQTPAMNVKVWIHQWAHSYPLVVDLPEPGPELVTAVDHLGPGGRTICRTSGTDQIVLDPYVHQIGTSEITIYVYGEARYDDIYGEAHVTRFRLMHGGAAAAHPRTLRSCPDGNVAT